MSRSGYSDDCDDGWELIRWRGAVKSAIRGKRGQAFLREMLEALDSLPQPRLIAEELSLDGEVCAIGSVGLRRGLDMSKIDPFDPQEVADAFGIPRALAAEIEYENDDGSWLHDSPERRFQRIRNWVLGNLNQPKQATP